MKCEDWGLSQLEYWGSFFASLIFNPGKVKRWSDLSESRQGAVNSQTLSFHSLDPTTASGYNTRPNLFVVQHKSALQPCSFPCKPNPKLLTKDYFPEDPNGHFFGSTFPGILRCMLFHDATTADLSALARGSLWEAHRQ